MVPSVIRAAVLALVPVALLAAPVPAQTASEHHPMHDMATPGTLPKEGGQAAFAAIQEIVRLLEADPKTDWAKVDIEALRQHLIDMNNVTLDARVNSEPVAGGLRFRVSGTGPVRDSIRRMVTAHAAAMDGVGGWHYAAAETADGASLTVTVPARDLAKLRGLGFIGVMALGMHHPAHHLMIARGGHPHG